MVAEAREVGGGVTASVCRLFWSDESVLKLDRDGCSTVKYTKTTELYTFMGELQGRYSIPQ